jgi:hypothetical protein
MGSFKGQSAAMLINFGPPQSEGTGELDGLPFKDYMDASIFFFVLPLPTLLVGFLSPLPFFHYFLFLLGYWVDFSFVDCTLCTSDV